MKNFDLSDRLNWRQACTLLNCSKSTLYRLENEEKIQSFGAGKRNRWYSKDNIIEFLSTNSKDFTDE